MVGLFCASSLAGIQLVPRLFQRIADGGLQVNRIDRRIAKAVGENDELHVGNMPLVQHDNRFAINGADATAEISFFLANNKAELGGSLLKLFQDGGGFHTIGRSFEKSTLRLCRAGRLRYGQDT